MKLKSRVEKIEKTILKKTDYKPVYIIDDYEIVLQIEKELPKGANVVFLIDDVPDERKEEGMLL